MLRIFLIYIYIYIFFIFIIIFFFFFFFFWGGGGIAKPRLQKILLIFFSGNDSISSSLISQLQKYAQFLMVSFNKLIRLYNLLLHGSHL